MEEQKTEGGAESNSQILAMLAYLGILVLIPYFMKGKDEFVAFHARQGMRLFLYSIGLIVVLNVVGIGLSLLVPFLSLFVGLAFWALWIGWLVLIVLGLRNVLQKKKEPLPIIG
jgi:uncharacterized membrane protein